MRRARRPSAETLTMLEVYRKFVEDILAVPIVCGRKSAAERFPGADETYTIEGLMGDGRALQCGTSHFLGQNFAKAFEIRFLDEKQSDAVIRGRPVGASRRGCSARSIMTHGDDQGLRLPPAVASTQVVVVPIWRKAEEGEQVLTAARDRFCWQLENAGIRVQLDEREGVTPGFKFNDWEMRGVPLRVEIGPRDVASGEVVLARRDIPGPPGKSKAPIGGSRSARDRATRRDPAEHAISRRARRWKRIPISSTATTSCAPDEGRRRRRFRRYLLVRQSGVRDQDSRRDARDLPRDSAQPVASAGQMRRVRGSRGGAGVVREGILRIEGEICRVMRAGT